MAPRSLEIGGTDRSFKKESTTQETGREGEEKERILRVIVLTGSSVMMVCYSLMCWGRLMNSTNSLCYFGLPCNTTTTHDK